ncbi:MAG: hypothetical protein ACYDAP_03615 [Thermoplasmataceae archaeon]
MKTAHVNDQISSYKDSPSKAEKIQELSEILDEIFSLKAKIKKTGDVENDGKR